jgi:hypothetical protein
LLEEEPEVAGELEHDLLEYLKTVAGKMYRPMLAIKRR